MIKLKTYSPFLHSTLSYPPGHMIYFLWWEGVVSAGWGKPMTGSACNDCMMLMNPNSCLSLSPSLFPLAFFPSLRLHKPLPTTKVWGTARLRIHTRSTNCSSNLKIWTLTDENGFSVNDVSNTFWKEYLRQYLSMWRQCIKSHISHNSLWASEYNILYICTRKYYSKE